MKVYLVSVSFDCPSYVQLEPHPKQTSKPSATALLAKHVHRVGYHFPSYIVGTACSTLGVTLNKHGRVAQLPDGQGLSIQTSQKKRKGTQMSDVSASSPELTQAAIDTQARNAIKDLFPNIPEKDLHDIVRRAFEKVRPHTPYKTRSRAL